MVLKKLMNQVKVELYVRSKVEEETLRNGRKQLIITEIPYEVNKSSLVKRIDELRADKKSMVSLKYVMKLIELVYE